jgi:hypothetical protein
VRDQLAFGRQPPERDRQALRRHAARHVDRVQRDATGLLVCCHRRSPVEPFIAPLFAVSMGMIVASGAAA